MYSKDLKIQDTVLLSSYKLLIIHSYVLSNNQKYYINQLMGKTFKKNYAGNKSTNSEVSINDALVMKWHCWRK